MNIMSQAEIPVVDFCGVFSCADLAGCPQTAQLHSAFFFFFFFFFFAYILYAIICNGHTIATKANTGVYPS